MTIQIIATTLALATAASGFIPIPPDGIAVVDLRNLHVRKPRQIFQAPQHQFQDVFPSNDGDPEYQSLPRNQYQGLHIPIQPYAPIPIQLAQAQESVAKIQTPQSVAETRPPDFGEYIDFGAHTGDNGAFGWYADYPLNNHEGGYRHRH